MLKEEYENLEIGDLVLRHFIFINKDNVKDHRHMTYKVISLFQPEDGFFLAQEYPFFGKKIIVKFHYKEIEVPSGEVFFDKENNLFYRKIPLLDHGKSYNDKSKKDKNQRRILRIKPLNVRDLFVEFKGANRKQGVIPYCKLPKEIIVLDMDPAVFDRAYIRRDGWLAWYLPNLGEYALSPDILYDLL